MDYNGGSPSQEFPIGKGKRVLRVCCCIQKYVLFTCNTVPVRLRTVNAIPTPAALKNITVKGKYSSTKQQSNTLENVNMPRSIERHTNPLRSKGYICKETIPCVVAKIFVKIKFCVVRG